MGEAMRLADEGNGRAMPRKVGFTVATLTAAKPPAGKPRTWLYDARTPGLAFMVTDKGAKSFYHYKKHNGRPQRLRLGGFPDISIEQARTLATQANGKYAAGENPAAERRAIRASITLQELFDRYTKEHTALRATERTRQTDKSRFDTCFADWKTRKLSSISDADVRNKHAAIATSTGEREGTGQRKITANRAMQLLRRMFNWARIEPNPVRKGTIDYFDENTRDRFLAADELPRFFKALEEEPNETVRDYIKLSLWTGARRSNVQSMRWGELNFTTSTWRVPAEKSKSGEAMDIHLSAPAVEILKARQGNGSDYVFPGRGKRGHLVEPKSVWKRILTAAKISDLRLHDLRRTLGSWQAATGASLPIIGKSLGHHDHATTAIYARLNLDPVRTSVDAAAAAILAATKAKTEETKTTK